MANSRESLIDEATKMLSDGNLHRHLWLPETDVHERLRVTFSTTINFSNTGLPTLLYCGPMFCSRYAVLDMNRIAENNGVRVICTDRPGMGGSTRVPLNVRIQVWLETVPALLDKLAVEHVGLFCHSAGTIYALNTLYHLRERLDPQAPYVAFMAPWVSNGRPHTLLAQAASRLPNSAFDYWHSIMGFAQQHVVPLASWSSGFLASMAESPASQTTTLTDKYGTTVELGKEIERLRKSYVFEEDTTGVDSDLRLCLRKAGYGSWGVCENHAEFVQKLMELEDRTKLSRPDQARLKVYAYFASSDIIIGKDGQKYFEESWRQQGVDKLIDFESLVLDETDHDSVAYDTQKGAFKSIFNQFAKSGIVTNVPQT